MHRTSRPSALALLALTVCGLTAQAAAPPAGPTVYVARGLGDESLIALGAFVAGRPGAVLLLTPREAGPLASTLRLLAPGRVIPVGSFPDGVPAGWDEPRPWDADVPERPAVSGRVVVCPALPRGRLLQAACLAGAEGATLWVSRGRPCEARSLGALARREGRGVEQITLVGEAGELVRGRTPVKVVRLPDAEAVAAAYLRRLEATGRVETAVVCNPADTRPDCRAMSALGPWLAVRRRSALLLTDADGRNVEAVVAGADGRKRLLDTLVLLADLKAIPMEGRPNPIPGDKDPLIDLEPLTPPAASTHSEPWFGAADSVAPLPFSYAVGRLFHQDRAVVTLMLARQETLRDDRGPSYALVASNPGGGLNLLETFSRTTARELTNAGYRTTTLVGRELTAERLRAALPSADLFLWEGHHNTLIKDWGFAAWEEPLPPALHFLQSCLALQEEKVGPLLSRGAVAVVGTSTRTYSGSGGAFSLAYLDALIHEHRTLGGSLRQAKNFLLTYTLLKEKRLGDEAKRTGANLRAAWAFTLWGDPTLRLPCPTPPADALPGVRHTVTGRTLTLTLPDKSLEKVATAKYQATPWANARLAGLVRKNPTADEQPLVPLAFAEVALPRGRPGAVPRLSSRLPSSHWVFTWDERRRVGYLLAMPRAGDGPELRFHIEWRADEVADREALTGR